MGLVTGMKASTYEDVETRKRFVSRDAIPVFENTPTPVVIIVTDDAPAGGFEAKHATPSEEKHEKAPHPPRSLRSSTR